MPEVRFPGFVEDGALALRFIRHSIAAYGGDPQRISVLGHSAGAYNAVMLALDPRFLAGAGVPAGTIRRVAALSGPYDFLPLDHPSTISAFGQARDLARTQPVNLVRRGRAAHAAGHRYSRHDGPAAQLRGLGAAASGGRLTRRAAPL